MWVHFPNAFLSIVAPTGTGGPGNSLLVRARAQGDIEAIFPKARVRHTPDRDYAYRAMVPRIVVATALTAHINGLGYTNFKAAVPERDRHDAYLECWGAMNDFQRQRTRRARAAHATLPFPTRSYEEMDEVDGWKDEDEDRPASLRSHAARVPY